MAQSDLLSLLQETRDLIATDTEWYRIGLQLNPHTYSNSVFNVTKQFRDEVGEAVYISQKRAFDKLIKEYVATLYNRIAKTPRSAYTIEESAGSTPTKFSITITPNVRGTIKTTYYNGIVGYESQGADPFKRIINEEKRKATVPLLNAVNVLLGTNYTANKFLDTGHLTGVAEKQVYSALTGLKEKIDSNPDVSNLVKSSGVLARLKLSSKWIGDSAKSFVIEVTDESSRANRSKGSTSEKKFSTDTLNVLNRIITKNVDWVNQKGSDSFLESIEKNIINAGLAAGGKVKGKPGKSNKSNAVAVTKIGYKASSEKMSDGGFSKSQIPGDVAKKKPGFDLSLLNLINIRLPPAVRANMQGDALINRTGRFSESVRVTGVEQTPQGFPSLTYTYQRSPYDVFDPVLGRAPWNRPGRDPKELIEKSIRDVAREMAIGRFYVKRAQ